MQLSLTTSPAEYKVMFVLIQLKVVILPMIAMTYLIVSHQMPPWLTQATHFSEAFSEA